MGLSLVLRPLPRRRLPKYAPVFFGGVSLAEPGLGGNGQFGAQNMLDWAKSRNNLRKAEGCIWRCFEPEERPVQLLRNISGPLWEKRLRRVHGVCRGRRVVSFRGKIAHSQRLGISMWSRFHERGEPTMAHGGRRD